MFILIPSPFLFLLLGVHLPLGVQLTMVVVAGFLIVLADILTVQLVIPGPWKGMCSGYEIKNELGTNPKFLKGVIVILVIALFVSLGFLTHTLWLNSIWKLQVNTLAGYEGHERARRDFEAGKVRLFIISGERDSDKFSGTNDGPFEVWFPQYYPKFYPFRYSEEEMAAAYNDRMKYLHEHAGQGRVTTNTEVK
jgi:hypothetical protein